MAFDKSRVFKLKNAGGSGGLGDGEPSGNFRYIKLLILEQFKDTDPDIRRKSPQELGIPGGVDNQGLGLSCLHYLSISKNVISNKKELIHPGWA
jgi:hypothetical protein